ncbi:unnamed protein product [Polarella glacialis]|uniref:HTH OST-type domain-containing protein n=1 Tax=Polarella glacialis TaxID=89957 RepID=A0A813LQ01_POLGL|nr:unnamed protein product [Polarella glacialis]
MTRMGGEGDYVPHMNWSVGHTMPPHMEVHTMAGMMSTAMPNMPMQMMGAPMIQQMMVPGSNQTHMRPHTNGTGQTLDMNEVVASVETLYRDELKSYGRILRKRLAERATAVGQGSVDVDIKRLRGVCEACPWLYVQAEEGGDWSALLRGRHMSFIDVYSPQDLYPEELWRAAGAYFESLDDSEMVLPGGRYSCAQALVCRGLLFLSGRSLGQVCHIVQLAISQKKLLGYLNGAVVPYGRSQSKIKERCAERQKPCSTVVRGSGSDLADWDIVKNGLRDILSGISPGSGPSHIPLSNVKRLFRSRFHIELSETALGHSKLSELLQDPRLRDVCDVRLQGHGYVVSPAMVQPAHQFLSPYQPQAPPISAAAAGAGLAAAALASACGHPTPPQAYPARQSGGYMAASNFGTIPGSMPATAQAAVPYFDPSAEHMRATAVTVASASRHRPGVSLRDRAQWVEPLSMDDVEAAPQPSAASMAQSASWVVGSPPSPSMERGHYLPTDMPLMTPTPSAHRRAKSVPRDLGSDKNLWEMTCQAMGLVPPHLDESTGYVEATGTPQNMYYMPSTPETPGFPRYPMLQQCTYGDMGYSVHNTFIHAAMPPPTPIAGSAARSHSLPRNMGASDKAEATQELEGDKLAEKKDVEESCQGDLKESCAFSYPRQSPGNRMMSAAAASLSGGSKEIPAGRSVFTPPGGGLKARGALAAAALASPDGPLDVSSSDGTSTVHSSTYAGSAGQRVVRLADLL